MRKALALLAAGTLVLSCAHRVERKISDTPATLDHESPILKIHMKNGDVYVLHAWKIDDAARLVSGRGDHLGADRATVASGDWSVRFDDVALYETNTIITSPTVAAIAIMSVVTIAIGAACIANPKACFGSCPTFYAPGDGGRSTLQAEGFSDAISPALESHDIDALWRTHATGGPLTLTMTNEAYETHVVKQADLLVAPRPPGGRVLSDGEQLWAATAIVAPVRCAAPEGDCLRAVAAVDGAERTSLTDEHDLATRETIELDFPAVPGRAGLVVGARQSLVTTFLLYQGLAYLGTKAGDWLAALERGDLVARAGGRTLQRLVGGIEVQVMRDGDWQTVGEAYETGPLATDVHLLVLPAGVAGERLRLRLPMGGWRIDYLGLAQLAGTVVPERIHPRTVHGTLGAEFAGGRTAATGFPIVTLPGDAYELEYDIPAGDRELFLDSRGYYLEWMRQEWLHETAPLSALKMLVMPGQALRDLAPAFKRTEAHAEELFWRSRYAHP